MMSGREHMSFKSLMKTSLPSDYVPTLGPDRNPNLPDSDPLRAEATPLGSYNWQSKRSLKDESDAQSRIRRYDSQGPGIVGAALDIPSSLATHINLVVQKKTPDGWVLSDDPAANSILQMWRGQYCGQSQLLRQLVRALDGTGECYQILNKDPVSSRWYYELRSTTNVTPRQDGFVEVRTRPDARPGSRWHSVHEDRFVYHLHCEDPEWPGLAWSPLHRGLPNIEVYRTAMRNIGRNLDSQLAMNGILWAKAVSEGSNWPAAVQGWARKAIQSDDGIEAVSPFLLSTVEEPKWIDVGRGDHADQIEVANFALTGFARDTDLPTKLLTDGPGAANHWGDYIINDYTADFVMYPRMERICQLIYSSHFYPWASTLDFFNDDPTHYRVWFDDSDVRTKTDNSERVLKAGERGIASRQAQAEVLGLRPDQVMDLPDGVSEYEFYLMSRGIKAPEAQEFIEPTSLDTEPQSGFDPADGEPARRDLGEQSNSPLQAELVPQNDNKDQ